MDKYFMWIHYERLHNHNKAKHNKTVCILFGIYCIIKQSIRLCIINKSMLGSSPCLNDTVYPKKYAHGFVVLCFVVVMQSFIMNSYEVFIHIHQGCFAGTGAIVRLPQCQWSKPDGYGKIGQYITTTKHSKTKTVCIFLGIYCRFISVIWYTDNLIIEIRRSPFIRKLRNMYRDENTVFHIEIFLCSTSKGLNYSEQLMLRSKLINENFLT